MSDNVLGRVWKEDPGTFDPNTPPGPLPGEIVADPAGGPVGVVVATPGGLVVAAVRLNAFALALSTASGGVLTRTVSVLVEDLAGDPVEDAIISLTLRGSVALVSVAQGATGTLWGRVITGTDCVATVTTGPAGTADLTLIVGGAATGTAIAVLLEPGTNSATVAWTF